MFKPDAEDKIALAHLPFIIPAIPVIAAKNIQHKMKRIDPNTKTLVAVGATFVLITGTIMHMQGIENGKAKKTRLY
jgi:hypothetical protein